MPRGPQTPGSGNNRDSSILAQVSGFREDCRRGRLWLLKLNLSHKRAETKTQGLLGGGASTRCLLVSKLSSISDIRDLALY